MSRIEEALEKAARLRTTPDSALDTRPERAKVTAPATEYVMPERMLSVTNELIVTNKDSNSAIAEEYRKLKSIVVKLAKGETFRNTLMITSSVACEGKSVTALNLAITLAQEYDHTVLLIDADLRKPSLHRYLGVNQTPGLVECLMDDLPVAQALVKTGIGKLTLLPTGRRMDNPVELFTSKKMTDFIYEVKHRYPDRFVIIDTTPTLPFAESRFLAQIVDGTIFVVREGICSLVNVAHALEELKSSTIFGVVYNDATRRSSDSGYYYGYYGGYYGGYGYGSGYGYGGNYGKRYGGYGYGGGSGKSEQGAPPPASVPK
jgi:exopolysaccharide/PEP-CTERM locus tyrosine autokinase